MLRWVDPRHKSAGYLGFIFNRVAGIGLVLYLYMHLIVLSTLTRGPEAWDGFVAFAKSPLILAMDIVLLAGLLGHGLNGLRVALVGSGIAVKQQRTLLNGVLVLAGVLLLIGGALILVL
ncbi:MAG: hypothetical protein GYB64_05250 [Chloroflexi bacterium]|nr:hypothetical protein [Chloroflexota bacterium]